MDIIIKEILAKSSKKECEPDEGFCDDMIVIIK